MWTLSVLRLHWVIAREPRGYALAKVDLRVRDRCKGQLSRWTPACCRMMP